MTNKEKLLKTKMRRPDGPLSEIKAIKNIGTNKRSIPFDKPMDSIIIPEHFRALKRKEESKEESKEE